MLDIPAGSMSQLYTSPGRGLLLDKAHRGTLVGSFDPDRDSLFIVSDFAFVLRALYAVSTCEYKPIGVKVKSEKNGSIRISVKTASKFENRPTLPSGDGTTSTQMITRLDLEKSVSCLADFFFPPY